MSGRFRPGRVGVIDTRQPINWQHPLNRGLAAWWLPLGPWSGGTTLRDLARAANGTLVNGPTWAAGPGALGAVNFDGTNDSVSLGAAAGVGYPLTVCVWARLSSAPSANNVLWWAGVSGATTWTAHYLNVTSAGVVECASAVSNSFGSASSGSGAAAVGAWVHVAGVWASATSRVLYVNGVQAATNATNLTPSGLTLEALGRDGTNVPNYAKVTVTDARRHSRALSGSEVAALYDQARRDHPDTLRRYSPQVWSFGTAAGGGVTATGAATLGTLTGSGAAAVGVAGSGSVALGELTGTGAGAVSLTASGAATLGTLTGSAAGSVAVTASGAATLGPLTGAASGAVLVTGSGAVTLGTLTGAGTAGSGAVLAGAVTLGALTGAGGGTVAATGTGAVTLGALTGSAAGAVSLAVAGSVALGPVVGRGAGTSGGSPPVPGGRRFAAGGRATAGATVPGRGTGAATAAGRGASAFTAPGDDGGGS